MTTTPQTEAQRLAALISATLDSQDDSYLTCSVTKCLLQQAATELLRLDSLRLELQTQLADYKEACTKAETRAVPASTGMHWTENEPVRLPASRAGRVYMAGPMTGLPELNFPAFNQEAERLRAEGLQVLNPADHGIVDGADWADYLRHDIAGLASCERIHLLRGWTKSKGACLEMTIAKALGMTVTYQFDAEMEHNNAPAVPQGEPVAAWLKAKIEKHALLAADCPGSSSVVLKSALLRFLDRLPPVAATPAPAPAVAQGETVAWMVYGNYTRQPFGMLSSAEAYMRGLLKSDPDGGYHIRPLRYATPAPAPAQERCSTCGYLTSEREHLGCLRRAVKDLDIATGGPYDAQEVGLTDETQTQDELHSLRLTASGGAYVG